METVVGPALFLLLLDALQMPVLGGRHTTGGRSARRAVISHTVLAEGSAVHEEFLSNISDAVFPNASLDLGPAPSLTFAKVERASSSSVTRSGQVPSTSHERVINASEVAGSSVSRPQASNDLGQASSLISVEVERTSSSPTLSDQVSATSHGHVIHARYMAGSSVARPQALIEMQALHIFGQMTSAVLTIGKGSEAQLALVGFLVLLTICTCCILGECFFREEDKRKRDRLETARAQRRSTTSDARGRGISRILAHGKETRGVGVEDKYQVGDFTRGIVHSITK